MTGEAFGEMLKRLRLAVGLSQNQLARGAGVDPAYVNRLERRQPSTGQHNVANPRSHVVLALAEMLDLTPGQTDRLLFAAGLATQVDWQTRAVRAEIALAGVRQALDDHDQVDDEQPAFIGSRIG